ncbi:hypothetical protein, partial [Bacillus nitratireducens]|uniref:hypothetical protein n=1 Tax=Bacillus nitratireducens TaxID=2026193 RepID=UPI0028AC4875
IAVDQHQNMNKHKMQPKQLRKQKNTLDLLKVPRKFIKVLTVVKVVLCIDIATMELQIKISS